MQQLDRWAKNSFKILFGFALRRWGLGTAQLISLFFTLHKIMPMLMYILDMRMGDGKQQALYAKL